jgi:hypothetical protein
MQQSFVCITIEFACKYYVYVTYILKTEQVAGRLLEDHHVPSDVILLGVPRLFDDTLGLAALRKYKYAVLACADAVSDAQWWDAAGANIRLCPVKSTY